MKSALRRSALVAAVAVSLIGSTGVAAHAVPTGSFKCIPQSQDFIDRNGNHARFEYLGAVYSAGHAFYRYHRWTLPFDNGIYTCQAA